MTAYADVDTLKETLKLGTEFDGDLEAAVSAASSGLDQELGRRFDLSDTGTVRLYTPTEPRLLAIDDLTELTSVLVDRDGDGTFEETWTRNTDFVLLPLNAAVDGEPFTHLEIKPTGSYTLPVAQRGSVKITGRWGWPATPDRIVEAAALIATQLLQRKRQAPFGVQIVAAGDSVTAAYIARSDPHVRWLVRGLSRRGAVQSPQLG